MFADSEQDDEPPWRFRKIRIRYLFTGRNLDRDKIARAIVLSQSRYCSVFATLRDCLELTSEFQIAAEADM